MVAMTAYRTSRRTLHGLALAGIVGLLGACGGSDDVTPAAESASEASTPELSEEPSEIGDVETETDTETETESEVATPAASTGADSATLTLDNGESFEFAVTCTLEPHAAQSSAVFANTT